LELPSPTQIKSEVDSVPFEDKTFAEFVQKLLCEYLMAPQQQTIDICLNLLEVLSSLASNQKHWTAVFPNQVDHALLQYIMVQMSLSIPILKAQVITTMSKLVAIGSQFLIQKLGGSRFETIRTSVFTLVLGEGSQDPNLHMQTRNSQALTHVAECFLDQKDTNIQLAADLLRAILNYACSNKEKVVTNALRALGFYLGGIDLSFLTTKVIPFINSTKDCLFKFNKKHKLTNGLFALQEFIKNVLLKNLSDKSPKVSWNSCIVIAKILENPSLGNKYFDFISILHSQQTTECLFNILATRPNLKTRIQATKTLLCYGHVQ